MLWRLDYWSWIDGMGVFALFQRSFERTTRLCQLEASFSCLGKGGMGKKRGGGYWKSFIFNLFKYNLCKCVWKGCVSVCFLAYQSIVLYNLRRCFIDCISKSAQVSLKLSHASSASAGEFLSSDLKAVGGGGVVCSSKSLRQSRYS